MGSGTLGTALGEPFLECFERGVVERDAAFVVELAERHTKPGAGRQLVRVDLELDHIVDYGHNGT